MTGIVPEDSDWKLKLKYGRLKTPYSHFTIIAEGKVTADVNEFGCAKGSAFMGMKTWASSADEACDMARSIGRQIAFEVTGRIQVYDTAPEEPPRANPHGYDIKFTRFQDEDDKETA